MARKIGLSILVSLALSFGLYSSAQAFLFDSKPANPAADAAYEKASHSVYAIIGTENTALGNAVAIAPHLLATTCHVALSGNTLFVRVKGANKTAKVIYHYNDSDLCILGVDDASLAPLKVRPSQLVNLGEEVAAISNAQDTPISIVQGKITKKYDKSTLPSENTDPIFRHISDGDNLFVIQTDALVSKDMGGGGIIDQNGHLIGLSTTGDVSDANPGFVIPTELILKLFPASNRDGVAQTKVSPLPTALPAPSVKVIKVSSGQETTAAPTTTTTVTATPAAPGTQASPETQAPMKVITPDSPPARVTAIGQYGDDKLGVYQAGGDECFISVAGTDTDNTPQSLSFWFPSDPNFIYVFPQATRVEEAYQLYKNYDDQDLSLVESDMDLIIANQPYPLFGDENLKSHWPILIIKLDENPTRLLMDSTSFLTQTKDANAATIRFGLSGLSAALSAERASCGQ